jgi:hypothetical protein
VIRVGEKLQSQLTERVWTVTGMFYHRGVAYYTLTAPERGTIFRSRKGLKYWMPVS